MPSTTKCTSLMLHIGNVLYSNRSSNTTTRHSFAHKASTQPCSTCPMARSDRILSIHKQAFRQLYYHLSRPLESRCSGFGAQRPRQLEISLGAYPRRLLWSPHGEDWRRRQLMRALPPLVAGFRFLIVESNLQQRLKSKLLVKRFSHGRCFHPTFEIKPVRACNTNVHE